MNQVIRSPAFELRREAARTSIADERKHRQSRLAASYRIFAQKGYDHGLAGHITARDPEFADRFWVAPIGPWFGHIRVSDLVLVDHDGNILAGEGPINQAGFTIHSAIHKARPDVVSAAHSHSIYGKAWSALGRLLDPITQDSCFFYSVMWCSRSLAAWCSTHRRVSASRRNSATRALLFCRITATSA